MAFQAVIQADAAFPKKLCSGGVIGIAQIEAIPHMLRSHFFHHMLHMSAQHLQVISRKGACNVFAPVYSCHSPSPGQLAKLLIRQVPVAVIYLPAAGVRCQEGSFCELADLFKAIII